jgi:hypothetical protein
LSAELQGIADRLASLYDTPPLEDVSAYLCDEATMRAVVGEDVERGEVLAVLEEGGSAFVGLYVASDVVDALASSPSFAAWQLAVEGISHLVYLSFRAGGDESVSALELELQAEVDKWALGLFDHHPLEGWGVPLLRARSQSLRRRLFADVSFLDEPGTEKGDRYRTASRAAARYVEGLEARWLGRSERRPLVTELRRFYRRGLRDKLEHSG